jgi:membrane protein YdbS with pleckstrin-like domain
MPRRRRTANDRSLVSEVFGSLFRLSHRVPLVGLLVAVALGVGWWWLRTRPEVAFGSGRILAIVVAVAAAIFLFLALVGFAKNIFPEATEAARQQRRD